MSAVTKQADSGFGSIVLSLPRRESALCNTKSLALCAGQRGDMAPNQTQMRSGSMSQIGQKRRFDRRSINSGLAECPAFMDADQPRSIPESLLYCANWTDAPI